MKKLSKLLLVLLILSLFLTACSSKNALVGRWELVRGDGTYYFFAADRVEFFSDGSVREYDYNELGQWKVESKDVLRVVCEDGTIRYFDYSINGSTLTIVDEDGDSDIYRKVG